MINGLAAVAGPTVAAFITARTGLASLFFFTAGVHTLMVLFTLTRILIKRAPPEELREHFVAMPQQQASQNAAELDPRAPEHDEPGRVQAA
jgi:hypothetical protein